MTREQYDKRHNALKKQQEKINKEFKVLMKEYIDANKEFSVGEKVYAINDRLKHCEMVYIGSIVLTWNRELQYNCVRVKTDGKMSKQPYPTHHYKYLSKTPQTWE